VKHFAQVKVPDSLPALVPLTGSQKSPDTRSHARRKEAYAWLEDVIAANLDSLFPGMEVIEAHPFHVTRAGGIAIQGFEAEDVPETMDEGGRQRKFGVVRLEVNQRMPENILQILSRNLEVDSSDVCRSKGLIALRRVDAIARVIDRPDLEYRPFVPAYASGPKPGTEEEIFSVILQKDGPPLHHAFPSRLHRTRGSSRRRSRRRLPELSGRGW
jgi:polyphosphate kinase